MSAAPNAPTKFEAPLDTKFVGSIDGRFLLPDRGAPERGVNPVQTCRSQSVTATELTIASPLPVIIGERVAASFTRLGQINGKVARAVDGGFVVAISASPGERKTLAATINWLKKRHVNQAQDHRAAARTKTRPEACIVRYGDTEFTAELFDTSVSGASLSTPTLPPLNTIVRIGHVDALVTRHMDGRFGVRFARACDQSTLLTELSAQPDDDDVSP